MRIDPHLQINNTTKTLTDRLVCEVYLFFKGYKRPGLQRDAAKKKISETTPRERPAAAAAATSRAIDVNCCMHVNDRSRRWIVFWSVVASRVHI